MANEKISQLPTVLNATLADIFPAVQSGTTVQESIQQLLSLISAGTNISVAFTGGHLQISATGLAGIGWNHITGTTATMTADAGYVADNGSQVNLLLPTTAAFGTFIYVQGLGAGGWKVSQNTSQQIIIGSSLTTLSTGSIASTNQYDSLTLVCVVANTMWAALGGVQGNITIV